MRHGTSRRQRSRSNNGRRSNNQQRTQVYDSNGPDVRIRGTAHQVAEKYLSLAKDATSAGDRIVAENYYQHAEHYIRIINEMNGSFDANKILGEKKDANASDDNAGNRVSKKSSNKAAAQDDSLDLPASILGSEVDVKDKTEEVAD